MSAQAVLTAVRARHRYVRYYVLALILLVTAVNLGDRANLSIAGAPLAKELGLGSVQMGYVFSAFAWAYVIGQLPGGWLLDRFSSIKVYGAALFLWSFFTFLQGYVDLLSTASAVAALFALRFLVGLVEAPIYPANNYIVAAWFPLKERGLATSIFSSAQYVAVVLFVPLMGALSHALSWHWVFWFMGGFGMLLAVFWLVVMRAPDRHSRVSPEELAYLRENGAMIDIEANKRNKSANAHATAAPAGSLLVLMKSRMMAGIYLGQYCITALQYFFITWFPIYLVKGRGMDLLQVGFVAALPAICGFVGSVLGGVISDRVLKRGGTVTMARKIPFISGMLLASLLVLCNFTDSTAVIVALMSLALFGKGLAQIGLAVVVDTSPPEIVGLATGLFGVAGNIAGIVTPIAIGYLLALTHSFTGAMYFVGAHAMIGALAYLLVVGKLRRLELPLAQRKATTGGAG
ncbi:MFS transporter [Chitinasiproducens palmae]|uniref:MFS transporter, ACS family, glucarate transporter n=1 Tax=Chitinasiproducens palmae TaxID=1770053 RepID=A0A1H2PLI2_9BURK|nr:MFS transporter [Chitinasiproducens palmae]SDV47240.1 MFS transporter, ACS family, glucarate transporter [Chitinasiproducens palmae]